MKYSYNWLNSYFDTPLPAPKKLADLVTFHALEVEGVEKIKKDSVVEISILPNRAHDCLCYEGMAREIGVLVGQKIKPREVKRVSISDTPELVVHIEDEKLCRRYMGRFITGVKVKDSPKWLKDRLASVGQRPINNVVDIMNFVMLETGQPLHAFDADKLAKNGDKTELFVRKAKADERIMTLDGKDIELNDAILVIADAEAPLAIAGIKGGTKAEITNATKNIVVESANFAPGNIRKTSRQIGIRNDSSIRFENDLSPTKATEAIEYVMALLSEVAAGTNFKAGKTVDVYPRVSSAYRIGASVGEANRVLGTHFQEKDVAQILEKLGFEYKTLVPSEEVLRLASKLEGVPYKLGASISYDAPRAFDCSSFVGYLYAQSGVGIPRTSVDMYVFADKIEKEDLLPGDVIFANSGKGVIYYETMEYVKGVKVPEGVDHCGMYLGDGKVIHATKKHGKVVVEELSKAIGFENIVGYGRVALPCEKRFVVTVPAERLDLRIKEDLIEEIGRIYGYEKISGAELSIGDFKPAVNKTEFYTQKVREYLVGVGFSEISTYAFTDKGDIEMENPIAIDKKFLRRDLAGNILKSLEINGRNAPFLGEETIRIFEVGKVFEAEREYLSLGIGVSIPGNMKKKADVVKNVIFEAETKLGEILHGSVIGVTPDPSVLLVDLGALIEKAPDPLAYEFSLKAEKDVKYRKISQYPFMLRDIAVFVPSETENAEVSHLVEKQAGDLLVKIKLFDVFEKTFEDGTKKTSYAFRLVFQSQERTLSDEEVNGIMEKITNALNKNDGWQVR